MQETIRRAFNTDALQSISSVAEQVLAAQKNTRQLFQSDAFQSITRWTEQLHRQTEAMRRSLAAAVAPAVEQWSLQLPKISTTFVEQLRPILEQWKRAWEEALPPNWEGFEPEDISSVVQLIEKTGYCLVWIPRAEILRDIMAAGDAETTKILLAHREEALDDASALLAEVGDDDLALEREAAEEAIRTLRDGHTKAAQALASSVFTSTAHKLFEMGTSAIRKRMEETHPDDAGISQLRLRAIFLAGARAFAEFRPDRARPVRRQFNRHNTAHRITAQQWTEANALSAIMLASAFVRELDVWFAHRRTATAGDVER